MKNNRNNLIEFMKNNLFLKLIVNIKVVTVIVGMLAVKLEQMMMVVVLLLAMKHLGSLLKMV